MIVGGGQAGLAMSEHLSNNGVAHLILEKERIVERWRTSRWDSLVANGPAWHDRFPTMEFSDVLPDAFAHKDSIVTYFENFENKTYRILALRFNFEHTSTFDNFF